MDTRVYLKILLVEDEIIDQKVILTYLDKSPSFDIEAVVVSSLAEAINCLKTNSFNLIILDLNLSDSIGINTIIAIKQVTDINILILTGVDMNENTLDKYNIKGYLPKSKLSVETLNAEMEISVETASFRKSRKRLESASGKLHESLIKIEAEDKTSE